MPFDARKVIEDPGLSLEAKRVLLDKYDPNFHGMSGEGQTAFLLKRQKPEQVRAVERPLLAPPGSEAAPRLRPDFPVDEILSSLPVLGGMAGGMIPGLNIPGAMAGAMAGSGLESLGRGRGISDAIDEMMMEGATSAGIEGLGNAVSRGGRMLYDKGVKAILPRSRDPLTTLNLSGSNLPYSVGQATQSPFLQEVENTFAGETKEGIEDVQSRLLADTVDDLRTRFGTVKIKPEKGEGTSTLARQAQVGSHKKLVDLEGKERQAYQLVDRDAQLSRVSIPVKTGTVNVPDPNSPLHLNKMMQQPVFTNRDIDGPIVYKNAYQFLQKSKDKLDEFFKSPEIQLQGLSNFKSLSEELLEGLETNMGPGFPLASWDKIKSFRTEVNKMIANNVQPTRVEGWLGELSRQLGKDIESSVTTWAAKDSAKHLATANASTQKKRLLFDDKVMNAVYNPKRVGFRSDDITSNKKREIFNDPKKMLDLINESPYQAKRVMNSMTPANAKNVKGILFEDLLTKSKDPANPGLSGDAAIRALDSETYRTVFSQKERADLNNFFRTAKAVESFGDQAGRKYSLMFRQGRAAAAGAAALGTYALTGDIPISSSAFALTGGALIIAPKVFATRILLNPRYARMAATQLKQPPSGSEAYFGRKTLLGALRGSQLIYELASGEEVPVKVNANNQIEPVKQ